MNMHMCGCQGGETTWSPVTIAGVLDCNSFGSMHVGGIRGAERLLCANPVVCYASGTGAHALAKSRDVGLGVGFGGSNVW